MLLKVSKTSRGLKSVLNSIESFQADECKNEQDIYSKQHMCLVNTVHRYKEALDCCDHLTFTVGSRHRTKRDRSVLMTKVFLNEPFLDFLEKPKRSPRSLCIYM